MEENVQSKKVVKRVINKNIKLRVTISKVQRIGEELREFTDRLTELKNEYDNIMLNIQGNWKDEAGNKFSSTSQDFSENEVNSLIKTLKNETDNIFESVEKYKQLK